MKTNDKNIAASISVVWGVALEQTEFREQLKWWNMVEVDLKAIWNVMNYCEGTKASKEMVQFLRDIADAHINGLIQTA
jgi:hypothetical protein